MSQLKIIKTDRGHSNLRKAIVVPRDIRKNNSSNGTDKTSDTDLLAAESKAYNQHISIPRKVKHITPYCKFITGFLRSESISGLPADGFDSTGHPAAFLHC
jgi:hypothetical protein